MTKTEMEAMSNAVRALGHEPAWTNSRGEYHLFVKISKKVSFLSFREIFSTSDLQFLRKLKPVHRARRKRQ